MLVPTLLAVGIIGFLTYLGWRYYIHSKVLERFSALLPPADRLSWRLTGRTHPTLRHMQHDDKDYDSSADGSFANESNGPGQTVFRQKLSHLSISGWAAASDGFLP